MKINMKKVSKILFVFIVLTIFAFNFTSVQGYDWNVDRFDGKSDSTLDGKAENIVGAIISITRIVATGIAIIMIIAVAMKYMMAAPGDRADIKKHAVVYIVGAVVLFGSAGILTIIQNFAVTNIQ